MEEHSRERKGDEQKQSGANGNAPGTLHAVQCCFGKMSVLPFANLMTLSRSPDFSEPQILYLPIGIITPIHGIALRF